MRDIGDAWDEIVMPEEYPHLMYLFVKSVTLNHLSPRFFILTIEWRDPAWDIDKALCYKNGNPSLDWIEEEEEILRQHYTRATRKELLQLLPRRTYCGIVRHAECIGAGHREVMTPEPDVPRRTSWQDWQLMQELGLSEEALRSEEGVKMVSWADRCVSRSLMATEI